MKIITLANQKGGVGKTTTAVSLAHYLALHGAEVLLGDFDPQGQSATALGVNTEGCIFNLMVAGSSAEQWIRKTGRKGLDIIPGNRQTATAQIVMNAENRPISAIEEAFKPLYARYDYIIFDTAPSVGGLQERAIWASDLVLLPSATEYLSSDGLAQILSMLNSLKGKGWTGALAGILPTFYDHTSESKVSLLSLRSQFKESVLDPIHRATVLRECAAEGVTIFEKSPRSRAANEYAALGDFIRKA